jgi:hypothetical protein
MLNVRGSNVPWGFERPSDVVVINLGTNDNGHLGNAAEGAGAAQIAAWAQSEAKFLLELVRANNPGAVIVWCYGMMGEAARVSAPVQAAVKELNDAGDGKIFYLRLANSVASLEGIGDGHPTVAGNINRSYDLVKFIAEKTGWDYTFQPQLQTMIYLREGDYSSYSADSAGALSAGLNYAKTLTALCPAAGDAQIQAATQLAQAAWMALETETETAGAAFVGAASGQDVNASVVFTNVNLTPELVEGSMAWKLELQNNGVGVQIDTGMAGYRGSNFKIEVEYYMPSIEGRAFPNTRLGFRYTQVGGDGIDSSNVLRRAGGGNFAAAVENQWAVWTIDLTDAAFTRSVNAATDFNIIKWGDGNDATDRIDYVYIRAIRITPAGGGAGADKSELRGALGYNTGSFIYNWSGAPQQLVNFAAAALKAEQDAQKREIPVPCLCCVDSEPNPLDTLPGWARPGIETAIGKGFVPDGIQNNFTADITRAEFVTMMVMWLEYDFEMTIDELLETRGVERNPDAFSDTNDPYILAANALGIASGSDGLFSPGGTFDRQMAAALITNVFRAFGEDVDSAPPATFADIADVDGWAINAVNFVQYKGLMMGDNNRLNPRNPFDRMAAIITINNNMPSGELGL